MKVNIPKALLKTAQEFSKFKTPTQRTSGFTEQSGQPRGRGDVVDTAASLMLTHYIASQNIPCKYQLSLLQGDNFDIETNGKISKTINVKGSVWQPNFDDFNKVKYHLAIKKSEFHKLNDIFLQVMVHLDPPVDNPHLHFCGWIDTADLLLPLTENPWYTELPHTGGSMGLWIPSANLRPFSDLIAAIS